MNSRQAGSGNDGGVGAFQSGADRRPGKSPNREGSNHRCLVHEKLSMDRAWYQAILDQNIS